MATSVSLWGVFSLPSVAQVDRGEHGSAAGWLDALERRHFSDLTFSEVARALGALSSCYVERRTRLGSGAALESRGKRAAFALFYGPLHFLLTSEVIRATPELREGIRHIIDLGCGTGAAGAAWALESGASRIAGFDRNPWAVAEANWTYGELRLRGRAVLSDVGRRRLHPGDATGILAAYTINELGDAARAAVMRQLLDARRRGARVLVIEPIARRISPWWEEWQRTFEAAGGCAAEWRFPAALPERQRALARAAGLDPRELTARGLWI